MLQPLMSDRGCCLVGAVLVEVSPLQHRILYKGSEWLAWMHLDTGSTHFESCGLKYYAADKGRLTESDKNCNDFLPLTPPMVLMWESPVCGAYDVACTLSAHDVLDAAKASVQFGFLHNSNHVELSVMIEQDAVQIGRRWLTQQFTGKSQEIHIPYTLAQCYAKCVDTLCINGQVDTNTKLIVRRYCTTGEVVRTKIQLVVGDNIFIAEALYVSELTVKLKR